MNYYESKEDELCAYLLAKPLIFESLCNSLTACGKITLDQLESSSVWNQLTILPLNTENVTRSIKPFYINYANVRAVYNWQDITVIGGSAFNAIEQISQYELDSHIKTHTTDIDAVWWPYDTQGKELMKIMAQTAPVYPAVDNTGTNILPTQYDIEMSSSYDPKLRQKSDYIITSVSPAIHTLALYYGNNLTIFLNEMLAKDLILQKTIVDTLSALDKPVSPNKIHFYIENSANITFFDKGTPAEIAQNRKGMRGSILSGSWSITAYLELLEYDIRLKLIDMSIHDGGSSQKTNKLEPANLDPTYSSTRSPNSILYLSIPKLPHSLVSGFIIPIPIFAKLFEQQRLALSNRIQLYWNSPYKAVSKIKIQSHHRRIQYLIDLINDINKTRESLYSKHLIQLFQLYSFPSFYRKYIQDDLPKFKEWMASCPLYDPPFEPCKTTKKDCAIKKCKINPNSHEFQKLCEENKVLDASLCEGLYGNSLNTSSKLTLKKTRKNTSSRKFLKV